MSLPDASASWWMLVLLLCAGLLLIVASWLITHFRLRRVRKHLGFDGVVVYADHGKKTASLISEKYGIVAKPDFVLRLETGEYAVVEYKSRENGRLYESDVAQVKASVLAARQKFPVTKAFVVAGTQRHEILIKADDAALYREIKLLADYVRQADEGDVVHVFAGNIGKCRSCQHKTECMKPI